MCSLSSLGELRWRNGNKSLAMMPPMTTLSVCLNALATKDMLKLSDVFVVSNI